MVKGSIRQRIIASLGVIFILMIVMAGVSYNRLLVIDLEADRVQNDGVPGLFDATSLRATWNEIYSSTLRMVYVDTTEEQVAADRKRFEEARQNMGKLIEHYGHTVDSDVEQREAAIFRDAASRFTKAADAVLAAREISHEAADAAFVTQLTPPWNDGRTSLRNIVNINKKSTDEATQAIRQSVLDAQKAMAITLGVALACSILFGYLLFRAITRPMREIVDALDVMRTGDLTGRLDLRRRDEFAMLEVGFNRLIEELTALVGQAQHSSMQVTTSVAEIAATSKEQQATATETAATTAEIGATTRTMLATSTDLVRTMSEVSTVAEQTAMLADTGHEGLTRMSETMQHVMEAAGSVNAKLAILNEKAGKINQVVSTITKVADQTNLLSLNAAIEAEKAGEYGRGFGVVATEIRRLADQTAVATFDIEQMVKEIQSAVSAGVMGMDKFAEEVRRGIIEVQQASGQLSQIIVQVQALAPRFQVVNEGMQHQASGAEQITQALSQLTEAAQQTVESLHQSTQAIDGLTLVANQLRTGVTRFRLQA
ncbi:chemotaxis protein [Robbsia andropogonis]|uniref:Chemotaxis protein n=1 Tax=Robbsia andropogonis TaxID=28092 RepID=A0A0F5JY27_9BURK|nr:methyl-accepting chemotaxis protein [Robbsia andropogonis]KKB62187.1 chemotaxis protein [Robbsia andropogonis]MCP1119461.1 methyl-accepting chemotaxis protein [Robbsia andropogonis]MCP1129444.1 methyl-accepting chemotaxis protein [Robbsia andropogonis]